MITVLAATAAAACGNHLTWPDAAACFAGAIRCGRFVLGHQPRLTIV